MKRNRFKISNKLFGRRESSETDVDLIPTRDNEVTDSPSPDYTISEYAVDSTFGDFEQKTSVERENICEDIKERNDPRRDFIKNRQLLKENMINRIYQNMKATKESLLETQRNTPKSTKRKQSDARKPNERVDIKSNHRHCETSDSDSDEKRKTVANKLGSNVNEQTYSRTAKPNRKQQRNKLKKQRDNEDLYNSDNTESNGCNNQMEPSNNWSFYKKSADDGILLNVTLDTLRSLISVQNKTNRIGKNKVKLTTDYSDSVETSSNNSETYRFNLPYQMDKYITKCNRVLPVYSSDQSSMNTVDTYLYREHQNLRDLPRSLKSVSTMEKTNAYLQSQTNALQGNTTRGHSQNKETFCDQNDLYTESMMESMADTNRRHRTMFGCEKRHVDNEYLHRNFPCDSFSTVLNHQQFPCTEQTGNLLNRRLSAHHANTVDQDEVCNDPTSTNVFQFTNCLRGKSQHFNALNPQNTTSSSFNVYNVQTPFQTASTNHLQAAQHSQLIACKTIQQYANQLLPPTVAQAQHQLANQLLLPPNLVQSQQQYANLLPSTVGQNQQQLSSPILSQFQQQLSWPVSSELPVHQLSLMATTQSEPVMLGMQTKDNPESKTDDTNEKGNKGTMSSTSSNIPKRAVNKKDQRLEKVGKCRHASLIFNILAGLCGFGSIGIGVWNIVDKTVGVYVGVTQAPSDHNLSYYCYGLCFLGFVAFIGFIFGCCALCKLNTCCLKVHYVIAAVTGLLVLCAVAVIHLYQESLQGIPLLTLVSDKVEIYLERFLNTSLVNNYLEGTNTMVSWNRLQIEQNCCGVRGIEDYKNSAWKNNSSPLSKMIFPNSCCVVQVQEKDYVNPKPTNQLMCQLKTSGFYHQTGCLEVIMAWYKQSSTISLLILGGLLLFEAICFTLATNISRIIGNDQA